MNGQSLSLGELRTLYATHQAVDLLVRRNFLNDGIVDQDIGDAPFEGRVESLTELDQVIAQNLLFRRDEKLIGFKAIVRANTRNPSWSAELLRTARANGSHIPN